MGGGCGNKQIADIDVLGAPRQNRPSHHEKLISNESRRYRVCRQCEGAVDSFDLTSMRYRMRVEAERGGFQGHSAAPSSLHWIRSIVATPRSGGKLYGRESGFTILRGGPQPYVEPRRGVKTLEGVEKAGSAGETQAACVWHLSQASCAGDT